MSLISLLIALAAERTLKSIYWQFNYFYRVYFNFANNTGLLNNVWRSQMLLFAFILVPPLVVFGIFNLLEDNLIEFVLSTLILVVCFGCSATRECYRKYLQSAYEGDMASCDIHQQEIAEQQAYEQLHIERHENTHNDSQYSHKQPSFGETLIWLNYRYYFAIMLAFVLFGAPGAVAYRLLVTIAERRAVDDIDVDEAAGNLACRMLYIIDWLPVRIATLGYMFVGHFSKAVPIWLDMLFDIAISPKRVLAEIAKASEDYLVDEDDCTAEPCLLVRLAKRNILLFLSVIALMTLGGVVS